MIHTEEDDEFTRIEHEAKIRNGQPYLWDVYISPSQRNLVLEEVAHEFEMMQAFDRDSLGSFAEYVRGMKK
jgi:hypothetical protein